MKKALEYIPASARILLGLVFFVFGMNGFFQFIPMAEPPPAAGAFFGALAATGYFLPLLKATEIIVGILLLSGRFVALALIALAPITVHIFAFHAFLAPGDMLMASVIAVVHIYLAWSYRSTYSPLFVSNAKPTRRESSEEPRLEQQEVAG